LTEGRVVVAEPGSWVNLHAWRAGADVVGVGQTMEGGRGATWLRAEATVGASDLRFQVVEVSTNAIVLDRATIDGATVVEEIEVDAGVYVVRLWPDSEDVAVLTGGVAIANPIWVE